MAQHFQEELLAELPEAVALVGTGDYHKIVDVMQRVEKGDRVTEVSPNQPISLMKQPHVTAPHPKELLMYE